MPTGRGFRRSYDGKPGDREGLASVVLWYNVHYNISYAEAVMKLKITTVGNSAGVILPKELLARLRLEKGDELFALETPDGLRLTAFDPELAAQMEVAERIMRDDRAVLRKLAR